MGWEWPGEVETDGKKRAVETNGGIAADFVSIVFRVKACKCCVFDGLRTQNEMIPARKPQTRHRHLGLGGFLGADTWV